MWVDGTREWDWGGGHNPLGFIVILNQTPSLSLHKETNIAGKTEDKDNVRFVTFVCYN